MSRFVFYLGKLKKKKAVTNHFWIDNFFVGLLILLINGLYIHNNRTSNDNTGSR